ncbi:MAG: class I SAM-dependent methyltransferase [Anaerolineales bacterium]|nr:MAG: class I SAM-dependent methyltransferase [Anaerolineales bacterium]
MNAPGVPWLHERYAAQALWTEALRRRLLTRINLPTRPNVLEVGSGTGCITGWISNEIDTPVWGIDLHRPALQFAQAIDPDNGYTQADGGSLPFPNACFDLIFCHFLLLWTPDPGSILSEMRRCTREKGWVIAFAEPDYGARIDYPDPLQPLGEYQKQALERSGAHANRGRQLKGLFADAGLQQVHAGLLGGEWGVNPPSDLHLEWDVLHTDLAGSISDAELNQLEQLDRLAWAAQKRILFVPTFYALGQKLA